MGFQNVYQDARRASAYASLEFPGTYALAYRDLPALYREHVAGRRALDFGCGAGRSTRFLKGLGFDAVGIDISPDMVAQARERDPQGDYRVIADGDFTSLQLSGFDLVQSVFAFDNVPGREHKTALLADLGSLLAPAGRLVSVVSAPEIYVNEWVSFTTAQFPANASARCGDRVLIVMKDVEDRRPVEDVLWTHEGYLDVYEDASLRVVAEHRPLGRQDEGITWVNETCIPPWVIYVLERMN